jgi:uncharacterized protein
MLRDGVAIALRTQHDVCASCDRPGLLCGRLDVWCFPRYDQTGFIQHETMVALGEGRRSAAMARLLTGDDMEAGLVGGLFLSAGGSGRSAFEKNRGLGRMALECGAVRLVGLDELDPNATVITATAVGAPGFANWAIKPRDAINAARQLIALLEKPPVAVICGHVPGFNAWLVASVLGLDYVDAAANGRGHPTVKMGGMGLASRLELSFTQVACSGSKAENSHFAVVAEGDIVRTSNVLRQAAVSNGGLIYAARGPLTAGFIKKNGATGAIAFQLALGRAMLAAGGADRVRATVDFLGGTLLVVRLLRCDD